jgi:hypothetical protein
MSTSFQHSDNHDLFEDLYYHNDFEDHNLSNEFTNQYRKVEMVRRG